MNYIIALLALMHSAQIWSLLFQLYIFTLIIIVGHFQKQDELQN